MNTLEIPDRDIQQQVPSHWDELPAAKIRKILALCSLTAAGAISELDWRVRVFYIIADIRRSWRSIMLERIMSQAWVDHKNQNIYHLANELTAFIFKSSSHHVTLSPSKGKHEETTAGARVSRVPNSPEDTSEPSLEINYDTVLNHFPKVGRLQGPGDLLHDVSFGEFRAALEELDEYFDMRRDQEPDQALESQLNRFIACLYRPLVKSPAGKVRVPFDRSMITIHARLARRMPPVIKLATLLWFTYVISYIQTSELTVGGRTINLSRLFPKPKDTGKAKRPDQGSAAAWVSILYTVAKEGIFGRVEDTDKAGLFDVLLYMYEQHRENQRLKMKHQAKGR